MGRLILELRQAIAKSVRNKGDEYKQAASFYTPYEPSTGFGPLFIALANFCTALAKAIYDD